MEGKRFKLLGVSGKRNLGFTLIELLIVIAIILILIAIALPNFLEAQIRARVTKSKGELRSLEVAMISYGLDWKTYPSESEHDCPDASSNRPRHECGLAWLTTPVAYITQIPEDPFPSLDEERLVTWYEMGGINSPKSIFSLETWAIFTAGPDSSENEVVSAEPHFREYDDGSMDQYAPTNGTKSFGDIWLYGGDSFWIGVAQGGATKQPNMIIDPLVVNGVPYVHKLPPNL
jgi:type II secretion system protein G